MKKQTSQNTPLSQPFPQGEKGVATNVFFPSTRGGGIKGGGCKAFTLVELIVVITILAILGTIAFISLQGYSKDARDTKRINDVRSLLTKINVENTKGTPLSNLIIEDEPATGRILGVENTPFQTMGKIDFTNLNENPNDFKDPDNTKDYLFAYAIGQTGSGRYNFIEGMAITETQGIKISGNYYTTTPQDIPSLFVEGGEYYEEGGEISNGGDEEIPLNCPSNPTPAKYFVFDKDTGTITGYDENGPKDLVIPCEIEGVKVKNIGDLAFVRVRTLKSVEIPYTVEKVGYLAFAGNTTLTEVKFNGGFSGMYGGYPGDSPFCSTNIRKVTNYDGIVSNEFVYFPQGDRNLIVGFFGPKVIGHAELRKIYTNISYIPTMVSDWWSVNSMIARINSSISIIENTNNTTTFKEFLDLEYRKDLYDFLTSMLSQVEEMSTKEEIGAYVETQLPTLETYFDRFYEWINPGTTIGGKPYDFEEGYTHFLTPCPTVQ